MEHDPVTPEAAGPCDPRFESPALIWWLLIPSGMGLTGLLALSPQVYALFPSALAAWLTPSAMRWIFLVAVALHLLEGGFAAGRAHQRGLPALRWGAQTLLLGYPSLRLLLRHGGLGA